MAKRAGRDRDREKASREKASRDKAASEKPAKASRPKRRLAQELGKLERDDAAVVTAAVSMTWRASSDGQVLIWFQGLSNSTKYRVSLTFE